MDSLLAAVLANPDDDLPRLAYADWCDDHGQPDRAAYFRAVGHQPPRDKRKAFAAWRRVVAAGCWPFLKPLRVWPTTADIRLAGRPAYWAVSRGDVLVDVTGGMATGLGCSWLHFRKHAADWFRVNPVIGTVILWDHQWASDAVRRNDPEWDGPPWWRSWWYESRGAAGGLPPELFSLLAGWVREDRHYAATHRCYPTAEDAHAALSAACVEYGKAARVLLRAPG